MPGIWAKYSEGDIGIADIYSYQIAKTVLEEYAGLGGQKWVDFMPQLLAFGNGS